MHTYTPLSHCDRKEEKYLGQCKIAWREGEEIFPKFDLLQPHITKLHCILTPFSEIQEGTSYKWPLTQLSFMAGHNSQHYQWELTALAKSKFYKEHQDWCCSIHVFFALLLSSQNPFSLNNHWSFYSSAAGSDWCQFYLWQREGRIPELLRANLYK